MSSHDDIFACLNRQESAFVHSLRMEGSMVVKLRKYKYGLLSTIWEFWLVTYLPYIRGVPSLIRNYLESPGPAKVSIALWNPFSIVGECQGTAGGGKPPKKTGRQQKKPPKSKAIPSLKLTDGT